MDFAIFSASSFDEYFEGAPRYSGATQAHRDCQCRLGVGFASCKSQAQTSLRNISKPTPSGVGKSAPEVSRQRRFAPKAEGSCQSQAYQRESGTNVHELCANRRIQTKGFADLLPQQQIACFLPKAKLHSPRSIHREVGRIECTCW